MDAHRLMLCIWLWLVCASVQCLPRVRLSSRQQIEGETRITIDFYIDDSVDATEQQVKDYLRTVIFTTTEDLQSYFVVEDIHLPYWIKYIGTEPGLKAALQGNKNTDYIYLDEAINALTAHFIDQNPPDIICLVTNYTIHNGDNIRKAYGYSKDHTLCKSVVSMLLAYAPDTAGYAGRMLSEMIRASVNPQEVPNLYHRTSRKGSFKDHMKEYLSTCNKGFEHHGPPEDNMPPQPPPGIPPRPPTVPEVPDTQPPVYPPNPPPELPPPPATPDTTAAPPPKPPAPPAQPPSPPEKPPNPTPDETPPAEPQPDYC